MPDPRPRPGLARWLRLPRRTARVRLTVLYGAAVFLACGATVLAFTYLLYNLLGRKTPPVIVIHEGGKVITIPIDGQPEATIHMAGLGQVSLDRQQLLIVSGIALAVIAVAAAAIGWIIAGRVLRPLRTITAAARRISASSLHERLALHGPDDELKELADTLDSLFARLEASFAAQRRFAANASHELRTPLTRERTLLQVTLADRTSTAGTWQAVGRELLVSNAEQERLIEALLTLASSEVGTGEREPLDLAAISSAALAAARPAISRLGLNVHGDLQPATLDGDPLLVQQLVTNLVDNAIRHNIPGGDIQIITRTSGGHAVLSVTNSGQVIPPTEVERLFQPFERLGPRPARRDGHGHGLGLSIVRAIAAAHGATIGARTPPEGGLAVEVTFFSTPPRPHTVPGIGPGTRRNRSGRVLLASLPPQQPSAATPSDPASTTSVTASEVGH
jgi:signal transduction histidine kinase